MISVAKGELWWWFEIVYVRFTRTTFSRLILTATMITLTATTIHRIWLLFISIGPTKRFDQWCHLQYVHSIRTVTSAVYSISSVWSPSSTSYYQSLNGHFRNINGSHDIYISQLEYMRRDEAVLRCNVLRMTVISV